MVPLTSLGFGLHPFTSEAEPVATARYQKLWPVLMSRRDADPEILDAVANKLRAEWKQTISWRLR